MKVMRAEGVPCDQLDKVLVEGNASAGIKDGGVVVAIEVCGDDLRESEERGRHVNENTDRQFKSSETGDKCIPGLLCIPEFPSWVLQLRP